MRIEEMQREEWMTVVKEFKTKSGKKIRINFLIVPSKGPGIKVLSQRGDYYGEFSDLTDFERRFVSGELNIPKIKGSGIVKIQLLK